MWSLMNILSGAFYTMDINLKRSYRLLEFRGNLLLQIFQYDTIFKYVYKN